MTAKWTAEQIKALRTKFGDSQEIFAKKHGVTKAYISLLEAGKKTPSLILQKVFDESDKKFVETWNKRDKENRIKMILRDTAGNFYGGEKQLIKETLIKLPNRVVAELFYRKSEFLFVPTYMWLFDLPEKCDVEHLRLVFIESQDSEFEVAEKIATFLLRRRFQIANSEEKRQVDETLKTWGFKIKIGK